jgi:hypothetical protein
MYNLRRTLKLIASISSKISLQIRSVRVVGAVNTFVFDYPDKLRPIGMGSAWRRLIGKYLIQVFAPQIAALFLPLGQLGIAVKGSIDLIIHTTKLQLELYLSPNQETRALPILDLENMFNKTSRIAAQDELISHPILRTMLPFVQLLYNQPAHCFFYQHHHPFPPRRRSLPGLSPCWLPLLPCSFTTPPQTPTNARSKSPQQTPSW